MDYIPANSVSLLALFVETLTGLEGFKSTQDMADALRSAKIVGEVVPGFLMQQGEMSAWKQHGKNVISVLENRLVNDVDDFETVLRGWCEPG